jgi:hypothetical protein
VKKRNTFEPVAARSARRPMRNAIWAGALLLAGALLRPALPAHAEAAPSVERFLGTYKYAGNKEQGIAIVEKALDAALGDMNMVMKALAKRGAAKRFADTIVIDGTADKLGIKIGENDKVTAGIGKTESVKSADGKASGKASHQFDGTKLTEAISGDEGNIVNVFTLSEDGKTLTRDANMTSPRMQKPLKYRLVYTRK